MANEEWELIGGVYRPKPKKSSGGGLGLGLGHCQGRGRGRVVARGGGNGSRPIRTAQLQNQPARGQLTRPGLEGRQFPHRETGRVAALQGGSGPEEVLGRFKPTPEEGEEAAAGGLHRACVPRAKTLGHGRAEFEPAQLADHAQGGRKDLPIGVVPLGFQHLAQEINPQGGFLVKSGLHPRAGLQAPGPAPVGARTHQTGGGRTTRAQKHDPRGTVRRAGEGLIGLSVHGLALEPLQQGVHLPGALANEFRAPQGGRNGGTGRGGGIRGNLFLPCRPCHGESPHRSPLGHGGQHGHEGHGSSERHP